MIAIAILAIGILGLMAMQLTAAKSNTQARKVTESAAWAADEFERLLLMDYDDAALADGATVTPGDSMLNDAGIPADTYRGPYTVSYTVDEDNPIINVKRIDITVAWNDGSGRSVTFPYYKGQLF
jgi:Tfp pilus assembly protein PilV